MSSAPITPPPRLPIVIWAFQLTLPSPSGVTPPLTVIRSPAFTSALMPLPRSTPTLTSPCLTDAPAPSGEPWASTSPTLPLIFALPLTPPSGSVSPSRCSAPTFASSLPPIEIVMFSSSLPKLSSVGRRPRLPRIAVVEQGDPLLLGARANVALDRARLDVLAGLGGVAAGPGVVELSGHVDELGDRLDRTAGLALTDLAGERIEPDVDLLPREVVGAVVDVQARRCRGRRLALEEARRRLVAGGALEREHGRLGQRQRLRLTRLALDSLQLLAARHRSTLPSGSPDRQQRSEQLNGAAEQHLRGVARDARCEAVRVQAVELGPGEGESAVGAGAHGPLDARAGRDVPGGVSRRVARPAAAAA